jgi:hypothetical protein
VKICGDWRLSNFYSASLAGQFEWQDSALALFPAVTPPEEMDEMQILPRSLRPFYGRGRRSAPSLPN